jgi:glycosyltransferase involved in cell wall biosynthesis
MGRLNDEFYRQQHAQRVIFAPNSVDNERFAGRPHIGRSDLLARWGLKDNAPVIMFCGKLIPRKRPMDLIEALRILSHEYVVLFVGDGVLAQRVRAAIEPGQGAVTGFINQAELPSYYHAADILVLPSEVETWGLVINEGMAAGTLPVVSDRVGAAPDLVDGIGQVYPCGDIASLAAALDRAFKELKDPGLRHAVQRHAARYSMDHTAAGFEEAVLALSGPG